MFKARCETPDGGNFRGDRQAGGPRVINRKLAAAAAVCALALIALIIAPHAVARDPLAQDISKLNQFVQSSDSPSMKIFREGRDLIENGQWAKAAEKFQGFVNAFPKDRDVDAALYWLAYAYKQQGMFREAAQPLDRLLKKYSQSSWADEAEAMMIEIAPHLGRGGGAAAQVIEGKKDEELKIVALQSLFEADEARATAYVAEWLKPGSTATRSMREAAVSLLGSHGGERAVPVLLDIARSQTDEDLREVAIHRLGDMGGEPAVEGLVGLYAQERNPKIKVRILRSLANRHDSPRARAQLLQVAQADPSPDLRKTAIRWLADGFGSDAFDPLMRIYQSESDREIKVQVLRTLADMDDQRARQVLLDVARGSRGEDLELRQVAIRWLADQADDGVVVELSKLYDSAQSPEIKVQVLRSFAEMHQIPRARAKLFEAARSEPNLDLRSAAIRWLAEGVDAQSLETLISLYDTEPNPEIKAALLRAFGESGQKSALRKLMDVARRDPSLELRKLAVRFIGESKDPEALKFLEDILK